MILVRHAIGVSFGDCDPAGIVFYPNYFRWMDATFHQFLRERAGGHARLCGDLGAIGIGLMETALSFRSPASPGDEISYRITGLEWGTRSLTIRYEADVGQRRILEGFEKRGLFLMRDDRMVAGDIGALRDVLETR